MLELKEVSKSYEKQTVVNSISFDAKEGEIVGFLGVNGAGKSTSMKMITGFIKPDKGSIAVDGINVNENPIQAQHKIGYLPEHNPLYLDMYVREYLHFQADLYKVDKKNIDDVIEKVGLTSEIHKKIHQLSKGYRQRVGLASAILHNPKILILDEPTTGLDPNQLVEIRELIKELGKDKLVLLSSHIMQEIEAVCNRVIIINKGSIILDEKLKNLVSTEQIIHVSFDYKIEEQFLKRIPNIKEIKNNFDNSWTLNFDSEEDARPLLFDFAKEYELKILELNRENKSLEKLFRELTQN